MTDQPATAGIPFGTDPLTVIRQAPFRKWVFTGAPTLDERVETAARVLHERRHPLGHAHTCDRCRADARAVLEAGQ